MSAGFRTSNFQGFETLWFSGLGCHLIVWALAAWLLGLNIAVVRFIVAAWFGFCTSAEDESL